MERYEKDMNIFDYKTLFFDGEDTNAPTPDPTPATKADDKDKGDEKKYSDEDH